MLTLDTTVPGYQRDWRIDLTGAYDRRLVTFKGSGTGVVAISELNECVNYMGQAASPPPALQWTRPRADPDHSRTNARRAARS